MALDHLRTLSPERFRETLDRWRYELSDEQLSILLDVVTDEAQHRLADLAAVR